MPVNLYPTVVFLTSAGALVLEIVAGRLIAPYVGMSLYTWTAIIAVVLAGLSAGHWIGGRMADAGVSEHKINVRITAALVAAAAFTLLTLPLLRSVAGFLVDDVGHPVRSVMFLTTALFFLPSMFIGVISPMATKAALDRNPGRSGPILGQMFAAGALGSILGTLMAGFVFISWIGTIGTVLCVAGLYGVLGAVFAVRSRKLGAALICLVVAGGLGSAWSSANLGFKSPCTAETDYFCIRIDTFDSGDGRESRLMVLDHLVHSINDRHAPTHLYSPYVHFVDEVVRRRYPPHAAGGTSPLTSAFFVGGGGYTLPRSWQATYPEARLVIAEVDPEVTSAAINHLWFEPETGHVEIIHGDARVALQSEPGPNQYDVVFGDAFHDISVPAHLVTDEFAREIAARLRPGGIFVSNIVDKAPIPMFVFAFARTLERHFKSVEIWLEEGVSIDDPRVTYIVLATNAASPAGTLRSRNGIARSWVRWPPDHLQEQMNVYNPPVLTDTYAPVERLLFKSVQLRD